MVLLWAAELLSGAAVPQAVLVAAIASTAFVLFISPRRDNARPRRVIGGHAIALTIGGALAAFTGTPWGQDLVSDVPMLFAVYAAGGVGLSMLAMAATDTEHGPAAGTALGVVAHSFSWALIGFVAASVLVLAAVHGLLRSRLEDLD